MKKNERWNSAPPKMKSSINGVWGCASTSRNNGIPRERGSFVLGPLYGQRHCLQKKVCNLINPMMYLCYTLHEHGIFLHVQRIIC